MPDGKIVVLEAWRRKPLPVEAIQWRGPDEENGELFVEELRELGAQLEPSEHWGGACGQAQCRYNFALNLVQPNGVVPVAVGSWIIRDPSDGTWWACAPDLFDATYEPGARAARRRSLKSVEGKRKMGPRKKTAR